MRELNVTKEIYTLGDLRKETANLPDSTIMFSGEYGDKRIEGLEVSKDLVLIDDDSSIREIVIHLIGR